MTTTGDRSATRTADRPTSEVSSAERRRLKRIRKRFARRQRTRRWLRWRPFLAVVLVLALLGGGVWLVFYSSVLAVSGVTVEGTHLLSAALVRRTADVPEGRPLATTDLEAIKGRVRALAAVRSVDVTRAWPDRVLVRVTERVPVATVEIGSGYQSVDADGVLFHGAQRRPAALPLITAPQDADQEVLREGADVASELPQDLRARVDHVDVASVDEISLVLRDKRTVVWGSSGESADKAMVLAGLLQVAPDATSYDVSVPGQPAYQG